VGFTVAELLDYLIRAHQDRAGDRDAEQFGAAQIDHQPALRRFFDRQVARLGALEHRVDIIGEPPVELDAVGIERQQRALQHLFRLLVHHRDLRGHGGRDDNRPMRQVAVIRRGDEDLGTRVDAGKDAAKLLGGAGVIDPRDQSST